MTIIDRLVRLRKRLMGEGTKDRSLFPKRADEGERRIGERRGRIQDGQNQLKAFIHHYWSRYYSDFPENDRRKLRDRRQLNPAR